MCINHFFIMSYLQPLHLRRCLPGMYEKGRSDTTLQGEKHGHNGELSTNLPVNNTVKNFRKANVHHTVLIP